MTIGVAKGGVVGAVPPLAGIVTVGSLQKIIKTRVIIFVCIQTAIVFFLRMSYLK
jgi:hypothetical protein